MEGVPDQSEVDAGMQLTADGHKAPLEVGQQQGNLFQIESPLQCPPQARPYMDWFVLQRGYVAEMIRREQEVVQRQLADMHRQQLDFMQKQEHLIQNILAALNVAEQNRGICNIDCRCERLGQEENNCYGESEVSFDMGGRQNNAQYGAGCQKHELVAAKRVQNCFGSEFFTASLEITLYNESPVTSRAAGGLIADPLKVVPVDKNVYVNSELAASSSTRLQCAQPISPMLAGVGSCQDTPTVHEPKRGPVTQQKHLSPQEKVSTGTSQVAGPKCTSGTDDDVEGSWEEVQNEAQAGRNTKIQALNAVMNDDAVLRLFGSTPSHVVGGAPPSETEFERIRTKMEFDPQASSSSPSAHAIERTDRSDSKRREFGFLLEMMSVKRSGIDKRHWEPDAACKCVVGELFTDEFRLGAGKSHSPADWDPGPDVAVMAVMLVGILQERQQPGKASAKSSAATPTFWMFSQQLGSQEQQWAIGVQRHNPLPVGSSTATSSQQSTLTESGRASSVQAPCWSSRSRRSPQWSYVYLYLLY